MDRSIAEADEEIEAEGVVEISVVEVRHRETDDLLLEAGVGMIGVALAAIQEEVAMLVKIETETKDKE